MSVDRFEERLRPELPRAHQCPTLSGEQRLVQRIPLNECQGTQHQVRERRGGPSRLEQAGHHRLHRGVDPIQEEADDQLGTCREIAIERGSGNGRLGRDLTHADVRAPPTDDAALRGRQQPTARLGLVQQCDVVTPATPASASAA